MSQEVSPAVAVLNADEIQQVLTKVSVKQLAEELAKRRGVEELVVTSSLPYRIEVDYNSDDPYTVEGEGPVRILVLPSLRTS